MSAPIVELTEAEVTALKQLIPNKLREHPEDPMIEVPVEDTLRTEALLDRVQRIKANAYAAGTTGDSETQARAFSLLLARAWDEGFDAGEQDVFEHRKSGDWNEGCIQNPYRARMTPDSGGAPDREAGESLDQRQGDQPPADRALPGQASALAAVRRGRRAIDDFNRGDMEMGALLMRLAVSLHLAETALAGPDDATRSGGQIGTMTDPYRGGAK